MYLVQRTGTRQKWLYKTELLVVVHTYVDYVLCMFSSSCLALINSLIIVQ